MPNIPAERATPPPADDRRDLAFLDFIRQLTVEERVAIIKSRRPNWTVSQIAELCGVSARTVHRKKSYRRLKEIDRARQGKTQRRGRTGRSIDPPSNGRGFSDPDDDEE